MEQNVIRILLLVVWIVIIDLCLFVRQLYKDKYKIMLNNVETKYDLKCDLTQFAKDYIEAVSQRYYSTGIETVKIKYHDKTLPKISKIEKGDWIDLYCAEDVLIPSGTYALLSLGISAELPSDYEAYIAPRSSIFKNFGLIVPNSFGIIDNSYCGNDDIWRLPVYLPINQDHKEVIVRKGDRLCQFRVQKKQPTLNFIDVENMENDNRGGIGSTGING